MEDTGERILIARMDDVKNHPVLSRLRLGDGVEITVTQIGKECHTACAIMARVGECIMPTRGLFAEVVRGGEIAQGAAVEVLERVPRSTGAWTGPVPVSTVPGGH